MTACWKLNKEQLAADELSQNLRAVFLAGQCAQCAAIRPSFVPWLGNATYYLHRPHSVAVMKSSIVAAAAALTTFAVAAPSRGGGHNKPGRPGRYPGHGSGSEQWSLKKFTSLVAFGDSYTDDSRLGYFINNNGSAPPVGWVNPAVGLIDHTWLMSCILNAL